MAKRPNDRPYSLLGMEEAITRRDFVHGALAVSSAAALTLGASGCGRKLHIGELDAAWTGPGGIGDYAGSNGNTASVVNAAHGVRDSQYAQYLDGATDTEDVYDLIIVGGGLSGLCAAYEYQKLTSKEKRCLILDNHPIFGGEAKGNVFDVDGQVVEAPQGSNGTTILREGPLGDFWKEIGLPQSVSFAEVKTSAPDFRVARDHFIPTLWKLDEATTGFYKDGDMAVGFDRLPLPNEARDQIAQWLASNKNFTPDGEGSDDFGDLISWREQLENSPTSRWLDTMTYSDFISGPMGLNAEAIGEYADPIIAISIGGLGSDVISAYGAQRILLPGVAPSAARKGFDEAFSFPIGNAVIARHLVKTMRPDAYSGDSFEEISRGPTKLKRLEKMTDGVEFRFSSMAVSVSHRGDPAAADLVDVIYARDGGLKRVAAKRVIMASGGWVNRRVVRDLPEKIHESYAQFVHAPILVANVAVRNWRFLEKLGVSAMRWFEGFGFYTCLRQPLITGDDPAQFTPDMPTVLTFYVPFLTRGLPAGAQASMGRQTLLATSFAEFEKQIRETMQSVLGPGGFDASRDIAGIILNRWGHAYMTPEPGFFYGKDGFPAPREAVRKGYGRIQFAHAELQGNQSWTGSFQEGVRAARASAA